MITFLGLLIPLVGLLIYFIKPNYLFIFWMMVYPLLCPIFCLLGGFNDLDSAQEFIYKVNGNIAYLYILLIFILFVKKNKRLSKAKGILQTLGLLCVFFIFHSALTYFSGISLYLNIKGALYLILPMLLLIMDERVRPKLKHLYVTAIIILLFQVVFVYLNFMGIRAYVAWYEYSMMFPEFMNLATGTFLQSNSMSDYVATIILFFTLEYWGRKELPGWQYAIIIILGGLCMLGAGSRMPIALTAIVFCAIVFVYGRKHLLLFITIAAISFGGLYWLGNYKGSELTKNEGVNRIIDGMTSFVQAKKTNSDDESTVRLSEQLIDEYFMQSPIIGNGRANVFENAYPLPGDLDTNLTFKSDARLAFMLVEYGVLGLSIYLMLYYNIFRYFRRRMPLSLRSAPYLAFFFFFVFSLTEGGLWDSTLFPYVYLYFFAIIRETSGDNLKSFKRTHYALARNEMC